LQTDGDVEEGAAVSLRFRKSDAANAPEFAIDLCATHAAEIMPMLDKYAEKVSVKRAPGRPRKDAEPEMSETVLPTVAGSDGRVPCPVCGHPYKVGVGMSMHTKTRHPEQWGAELLRREKEKEAAGK